MESYFHNVTSVFVSSILTWKFAMFISPTNSSLEICSLFFSNHWCKVPRDAYLIANTAESYRASFFTPTCSSQPCSFLAGKPEKAYPGLFFSRVCPTVWLLLILLWEHNYIMHCVASLINERFLPIYYLYLHWPPSSIVFNELQNKANSSAIRYKQSSCVDCSKSKQ